MHCHLGLGDENLPERVEDPCLADDFQDGSAIIFRPKNTRRSYFSAAQSRSTDLRYALASNFFSEFSL